MLTGMADWMKGLPIAFIAVLLIGFAIGFIVGVML